MSAQDKARAHGAYGPKSIRRLRNCGVVEGLLKGIMHVADDHNNIVDLGAGAGCYVDAINEAGYQAVGVDAAEVDHPKVYHLDLVEECLEPKFYFDAFDSIEVEWCLFLEVGEHVPQKYEYRLLNNVCDSMNRGIISWASPGQRGRGHVNCRTPQYVASEFARRGLFVDEDKTMLMRSFLNNKEGRSYRDRVMVVTRD